MEIPSHRLETIENLHLVFRSYRSHDGFGHWYRGQADASWQLLPKAGRPEYYLPDNRDLGRFRNWCQQAIAYSSLPSNDLERLAIAQHHGLTTRLLDWTKNPLVACFFASCESPEADGTVYILETPQHLLTDKSTIGYITSNTGVFGYIPNAITPRVLNQKGLFTVHCDASQEIEASCSRLQGKTCNILQLVVPAQLKRDVIELLDDYGVDRSTLFPDLDGLSAHINRHTLRIKART